MMTLTFAFWLYVIIFMVIGGMRGWAKELLVMFSVILSLFLLQVMGRYVPPIRDFFAPPNTSTEFWARSIVLVLMVFFGYQTPNITRLAGTRFARERLADSLLGVFLGAVNGFLIVGTLWYFLQDSGYPFPKYITKPAPDPIILSYLPPRWLGIPGIYFAIAVAFLFVLIVFI
ncbi:MAG TPA: CvpA family protein [Anaerolineales bacterium]|nr:CvpA family protein [Anaerolineales bacterium]